MNITIDTNSGLFKLFNFAKSYTLAGLLIESDFFRDEDWNTVDTFNSFSDVCTFIRHFFIGILILMPITLVIYAFIIFSLAWMFIWLPITALLGFGPADEIGAGYSVLWIYFFYALSYLTICFLQYRSKNKVVSVVEYKEPGTIGKITQIISAKHSKFCTRIDVVNGKKEKDNDTK